MILFDATDLPATAEQLTLLVDRFLRRSVDRLGPASVKIDGQLPRLTRVVLDLSGGVVSTTHPPEAEPAGPVVDGPVVDSLTMSAHPITVQGASADFDLSATGVTFATGKSADGKLLATLKSAIDGSLTFKIAKKQIEAAILTAAKTATATAGVEIKAVDVQLTSAGPRTVDVLLSITVKKFMTAVVKVSGRLSVNDQMVASATGPKVDGEGMAGSIAAGFIRPHLPKIHDTRISFLPIGGMSVRDLSFTTIDGLQLDAKFGGNP
jgi:hypothetical protein